MGLEDVTDWWDRAAQEPRARRFIHPLGVYPDPEPYIESGRALALALESSFGEGVRTIVDFGAGDGRVAIPLADAGYHVIAVDASAAMIERIRTLDPRITTVISNGIGLAALLGSSADVVLALAVLIHHTQADAARIVEDLALCARPGGRLILDIKLGEAARDPATPISVGQWTMAELEELVDRLGLIVERAEPDSFVVLRRP